MYVNFHVASSPISFLGRDKNSGAVQLREKQDDQKRNRVRHMTSEQMNFPTIVLELKPSGTPKDWRTPKPYLWASLDACCSVLTHSDSM